MKLRTITLLLALVLVAIFAVLNWAVISQNTALNFGLAQVQAPLGIVLLGMMAVLVVLFLLYVVYMQAGMMFESRRQGKELEQQRSVAEQAEQSRFTELRNYMQGELLRMDNRNEELHAQTQARLEQIKGA